MNDYLAAVISPLITNPQALTISEGHEDEGISYSVRVLKPDMGRVIGKGGEVISAIRVLGRVWGARNKQKVMIRVIEPEI